MSQNEHITDHQLFQRIAVNDEAAFRQLFHRYVPEIRPVILHIVGQESVIADIVQEIFLRIWLGRQELVSIQSPRAWIFRIVYFQCFNCIRQQKTREKKLIDLLARNKSLVAEDQTAIQVSFDETVGLVKKAIADLPPRAREIYRLSREEGMKVSEIAAALDLSTQTVKNTITRSLQGIRSSLERSGIDISIVLVCCWLNS